MKLISSVQTTSFGWRLSRFLQRIEEQWELMERKLGENIAGFPLFSGLDTPLVTAIARGLFWLIVGGLLIWISLKIQRWLKTYLKSRSLNVNNQGIFLSRNSLMTEAAIAQWVKQAQRWQKQGHYRKACQCLYQAMLQQLHDRGIASHQASRTDGEYEKIIEALIQPQPYRQLLDIHQELCFGNLPPSLSLLETCWSAYREIEKR